MHALSFRKVVQLIREEFENGRDYYVHQGKPLLVTPTTAVDRPDPAFLKWHNEMYERGGIVAASG